MTPTDKKRIADALQVLYEEGLKFYKPEYQAGADRWDAIGNAITESTGSARVGRKAQQGELQNERNRKSV